MTRRFRTPFLALLIATAALTLTARPAGQSAEISGRVRDLHARAIVVDGHADTTQRLLFDKAFDIGRLDATGGIDVPRMTEGGLDAVFFSIWMPGSVTGPLAVRRALQQIDHVREAVRKRPESLVLATSAADIRRAAGTRRIAALMGVEGGHMIDNDLGVLRQYAALGVRYLTLTHSLNTSWADSSGDKPLHNGLTAFGREVVRELNRLGVMVDISHVSDKTFFDTLAVTTVPVIASHSSCRALTNSPRNMTDDMLRALAVNDGIVMINYAVGFISEAFRAAPRSAELRARTDAADKACGDDEACSIRETARINHEAMIAGQLPTVGVAQIIEHIEHAVKVAGVDHVGLGSDFDGATMPVGMESAAQLPQITAALLKKGYSDADITKILGGNLLRVMERVERAAR